MLLKSNWGAPASLPSFRCDIWGNLKNALPIAIHDCLNWSYLPTQGNSYKSMPGFWLMYFSVIMRKAFYLPCIMKGTGGKDYRGAAWPFPICTAHPKLGQTKWHNLTDYAIIVKHKWNIKCNMQSAGTCILGANSCRYVGVDGEHVSFFLVVDKLITLKQSTNLGRAV